jgi:RNA polymerase sigma-70 factor, ECF subfamily
MFYGVIRSNRIGPRLCAEASGQMTGAHCADVPPARHTGQAQTTAGIAAASPLPFASKHADEGRPADDAKAEGTFRSAHASPHLSAVPYVEFAEVALSYLNQLYGAARRLTGNAADADDLVQETYLLALQHYKELRSLAHCRAWLYRILHRQAVTRYRRRHARPGLLLVSEEADGSDQVTPDTLGDNPLEHVALQEIRDAIDALPSDLRIAVTLCDIEGFPYAEIAHITDCPVGTVRSRIARARAKLMTMLRANAEDCGIRCPTP